MIAGLIRLFYELFFDAKSEEIQNIFSGGPQVDIATLIENLNRMAPTKRNNWTQIKY